jgi:hypothetical protein
MRNERAPELERPETWDLERPEVREPVKAPRVVVSVAFPRDHFEQVSVYAERIGKRTSEFIREAAIEKATGRTTGTLLFSSGSTGALWVAGQMPAITSAFALLVEDAGKTLVTTY